MNRDDLLALAASVEALATVAAVIAAVWAGVYAKRAFEKEVERDRERDNDRRRAQADRVAVWCEEAYDYDPPDPGGVETGPGWVSVRPPAPEVLWLYYLRNASDGPVYSVEVSFYRRSVPLGSNRVRVLPPAVEPLTREVPDDVRTKAEALAADDDESAGSLTVKVRFRDAAGRRWVRDENGRLQQYVVIRRKKADRRTSVPET